MMPTEKQFKTVKALQDKIDEYFDHCDNRIQQVYSKARDEVIEIINPEPYTIEGLAYALGFTNRQSVLNYEKKAGYEKYFDTIKKAKLKVEKSVVLHTFEGKNAAGSIFNLKNNFGHVDKTEMEISKPIEQLTEDELNAMLKDIEKKAQDGKTL